MAHLIIDKLVKSFGGQPVLKSIDLAVEPGSFVALLGPSGCGKSTLLRIVAGLERVDSGRVQLAGRDITDLPPEKRNAALMFQSYALLPHMTVAENVRFPLRMQGRLARAQQEEKVREALALVQLDAYGDRYPRQLSGGQQQRVALARSIVAEPDILLLDEPLSNLDARLREDMQVELKRLHARLGLTTLFVTHDQTEALALADQVVLMNGGRIEQQGTPQELYDRPRTAFAADFIGGANVLTLEVSRDGSGWAGRLPDGTAVPLADAPSTGRHRFMLRKEAIGFGQSDVGEPGSGTAVVAGRILTQNFLGSVTRSVVTVGGTTLTALTPAERASPPATEDGTVPVNWPVAALLPLED